MLNFPLCACIAHYRRPSCPCAYSHTLENKSSLPPKPPPLGLLLLLEGGAGLGRGGEIGAALLQPPKSSSAVTFGGACEPKPPLPKPPLDEAVVPHAKSFEGVEIGGDLNDGASFVVGTGSGVAHASFEPQASLLEIPEKVLLAVDDAIGADFGCKGAGADRLKADCRLIDVEEGF